MEDMKVTASKYDFKPAHAAMQRYVDGNLLSGVSSAVLVGRDLVDVNCAGWADKEAQTPLRTDHIFRVFSNTKLITSCAALLLFEEGKFRLDDPIEKFIPQLANRKVLRPGAESLDETDQVQPASPPPACYRLRSALAARSPAPHFAPRRERSSSQAATTARRTSATWRSSRASRGRGFAICPLRRQTGWMRSSRFTGSAQRSRSSPTTSPRSSRA